MNLPFSLFLALKYLRPKRTFLSVVTVLSVLGVLLGVAVLVIVLSVMNGFDAMWRDKILAFNAHITLVGPDAARADAGRYDRLESVEGVQGAAPFVQGLVFLSCGDRLVTPFLRGVDPAREPRVSRVPEHVVAGRFSVRDREIVLGSDLAQRLGVRVGDTLLAYSPQGFASADEIRLPEELTVSGIFELGMYDFDMGYALCSLGLARDLFGRGAVEGVQVMTRDPNQAPAVARRIGAALGPELEARTWMELNRQLFAVLRVEKNMMFFLLIFITIVAAFGITNTLITVTVQKTREIGLLKALGFGSGAVMRVFLWQGWVAGLLGTAGGIAAGLAALRYRNGLMHFLNARLGMELLPEEYYRLSEIPAHTTGADLATVAVAVLAICTLAGIVPAARAARLDPARALRYE